MECWNCGASYELDFGERLSFRAECESCGAWLHVCKNCKFYKVGAAQDCLIPGIDLVTDKEKMNLCEEFKILGKREEKGADVKEAVRRLFGEEETTESDEDDRDPFSRLFKDD